MIKAIVRPDREEAVIRALEQAGFSALTKWDVLGRGRQRGIQVGAAVYGELAKLCLMVVVPDADGQKAVDAIMGAAKAGQPGDGRIFVSDVKESWTIRTAKAERDASSPAPPTRGPA